jgi:hypothetical protein
MLTDQHVRRQRDSVRLMRRLDAGQRRGLCDRIRVRRQTHSLQRLRAHHAEALLLQGVPHVARVALGVVLFTWECMTGIG